MGYPGRHTIYEATIRRMVTQALEAQESDFKNVHKNDTNEELIAYLRDCTNHLGRVPWQIEVVGGSYIAERFGSWDQALYAAGISFDYRKKPKTFLRVQEETECQKEIYRQHKVEKKRLAEARKIQQAEKRKKSV